MNILDPTKFVDLVLYGRAVFQGAGDGAGVQAMQADDADGTNAEPVPDGPAAVPVGTNWELTIDSVQAKKRFVGVAGATGAVGQVPRYAEGFSAPAPAGVPEAPAPAPEDEGEAWTRKMTRPAPPKSKAEPEPEPKGRKHR